MSSTNEPLLTRRGDLIARLGANQNYDIAIVGGGATGLGVALDAAARGFRVVLVEAHDFAKGTSSRSTKLVHGGVRYLAQGHLPLVYEALHERKTLLINAPHIAQALAFVVPAYRWWEKPFYGLGLKVYDALAGRAGLGKTEFLNRDEVLSLLPTAQPEGLKGGVKYWDGQFNDAKLALALARTAALQGALLLNYCRAQALHYENDKVAGLWCEDVLTGLSYQINARCVVNATGVWVDALRETDAAAVPGGGPNPSKPIVAPSQGVHLVVDRSFLAADVGLLIPKTRDGRVLFALPWLGKVILGTTDTPSHNLALEPLALKEEVDFILNESARYLCRAPQRADVKSVWVGLRPLVKAHEEAGGNTQKTSREHTILASRSGLVTVTGGKWTTYRAMAEDVLDVCAANALLENRAKGLTQHLSLVGGSQQGVTPCALSQPPGLHSYGDEQAQVTALRGAERVLCEGLTEAMVRFAARYEYALTVEDVLARRSRLLFLDARLASKVAPQVGQILREENKIDPQLSQFLELTERYLHLPV